MNEKNCSKCKTVKPLDAFYRSANGKPLYWCKECAKNSSKAVRLKRVDKAREYNKKWRIENHEKALEMARSWRDRNGDYVRAFNRDQRKKYLAKDSLWDRRRFLKNNYGPTLGQYEAMYKAQNGTCAICHSVNTDGRRLAVDHNHKTGENRGLLCMKCNSAIGLLREDESIFAKAVSYLNSFKTEALKCDI